MSEHVRMPVEGMTCTACVAHITRALRRVDGVESVKVDLGKETTTVGFDPVRTSLPAIARAIRAAGYEPRLEAAEPVEIDARTGLLARFGFGR